MVFGWLVRENGFVFGLFILFVIKWRLIKVCIFVVFFDDWFIFIDYKDKIFLDFF